MLRLWVQLSALVPLSIGGQPAWGGKAVLRRAHPSLIQHRAPTILFMSRLPCNCPLSRAPGSTDQPILIFSTHPGKAVNLFSDYVYTTLDRVAESFKSPRSD